MHGEYKVPGGKLVRADIEVTAARLVQVQVSGDFFLEPPEALEAINQGLIGLPADASETELALAIQSGLPQGTEMFGFSAEAIAIAVRRALA